MVVTGGSRGIGKAIAQRFVREGASACVAANEPLVHEAAAELAAQANQGGKVIGAVIDVTDRGQVKALYARVAEELGEVDISVQNAGVITIAASRTSAKQTGTRSWTSTPRASSSAARRQPCACEPLASAVG